MEGEESGRELKRGDVRCSWAIRTGRAEGKRKGGRVAISRGAGDAEAEFDQEAVTLVHHLVYTGLVASGRVAVVV